uniref:NADH-ubiquinone oxidoreductase chain 2 n=1 Tax=Echinaster brasiliensis TaxID=1681203 RepID=A0A343XBL9_9ECHI|nr:NADH dehydrogenase subunit 2 [Echinaster brasiliensis]AWK29633.1 NADH dehydrogenase subunit 2 [Echinaster brasiliensis]
MHRSTVFLLLGSVFLGTFIVVLSGHWFSVWVGLEINTLSIIPILCYQFTPRSVESTVKYFVIQSISAAMILNVGLIQSLFFNSWLLGQPLGWFSSSVLGLAVAFKLGLFPCHFWFPDVLQGVGFIQGLVLSTWQKVAPLVVLVYVVESLNVILFCLLGAFSSLVGGWGGLNQVQVRKILAFSSIGHLGWVSSVVCYSWKLGLLVFVVYVVINSVVFLLSWEFNLGFLGFLGRMFFLNYVGGLCFFLVILSLGGLPPLFGFSIKFLALDCIVWNGGYLVGGLLIFGSLLSLFFYLRMAVSGSLSFFPQHAFVFFIWRSILGTFSFFSFYGIFLSCLVIISVFGMLVFSVLVSFFENIMIYNVLKG